MAAIAIVTPRATFILCRRDQTRGHRSAGAEPRVGVNAALRIEEIVGEVDADLDADADDERGDEAPDDECVGGRGADEDRSDARAERAWASGLDPGVHPATDVSGTGRSSACASRGTRCDPLAPHR